jgi:hypothetical protein
MAFVAAIESTTGVFRHRPPPLSGDINEDQAILSAMEAEKAASADAGDMDEALRVVDDPRDEFRQQRVQQAGESA